MVYFVYSSTLFLVLHQIVTNIINGLLHYGKYFLSLPYPHTRSILLQLHHCLVLPINMEQYRLLRIHDVPCIFLSLTFYYQVLSLVEVMFLQNMTVLLHMGWLKHSNLFKLERAFMYELKLERTFMYEFNCGLNLTQIIFETVLNLSEL